MISLNFVEFDCSCQDDGGSGDLVESKFIRMCYFEGGDYGAGDGIDVGVKRRYDCDSQVWIGEVRVVEYTRSGDQALDRTQNHALDVVCDHARRGGEGCMIFESLNLCFQFGGERVALTESSSPRYF